ncbi:condensation domain-containing protein [Kitasatospora sp. NPDC002965]|uniref:condensation domain-containing protein n=1 Tax=Kitasatospora sp. NPDC002965 TaxID=3154775 RepID=UPI0033A5497D
MNEPVPLSYGQLSVWRDVRHLARGRWHEANVRTVWIPPEDGAGVTVAEVQDAVLALAARHESLRTVYDVSDPFAPSQRVLPTADGVDAGVVECTAETFDGMTAALAAEPFDLGAAPAWRFRVATEHGRPRAVVVIKHHIVADGWSLGILESGFRTALERGKPSDGAPPPTPRELAVWQHATGRGARRAALTGYWERVFGLSAAQLGPAGPGTAGPGTAQDTAQDEAVQYTVRSRAAHAAARRLAEELSVPLSSVVLAAFARTAALAAGPGALVGQLMSSNRFVPPWNGVVSSMNQWAAAPFDSGPEEFGPYARHVHTRSLTAFRYGMYDVDEVDALRDTVRRDRDPYRATFAFNFLPGEAPPPCADDETGPVREDPFSRIGHPCYLRVTNEGEQALELRLRTMGLGDALTLDLLRGTVARLADSAS